MVLRFQYIGVFNFRYTIFLCLKLGIKHTGVFLILVCYTIFSIVFGILQGSYFGDFCSGAPRAREAPVDGAP